MSFLKFNKAELVNLSYSLKREILGSNKTGAYCNTTIVNSNTRRYHGLLAVTLDRFGGDRYLLLSDLDETLVVNGKQFNLGIHRYGENYEPRGHKYVVDFDANPVPQLTYKVGEIVIKKSLMLALDRDQVLVKYELLEAPSTIELQLKPFLAFRNIHDLTHENPDANTSGVEIENGMAYRMYANFPNLNLQVSDAKSEYVQYPVWYKGITYADEARRGFECAEDLMVPGWFSIKLRKGGSVVFSASLQQEDPAGFKRKFTSAVREKGQASSYRDQLARCANRLITNHNGRKKINAGFSWMYTGLLRETLMALPGLTLYGLNDPKQFEEILDNLIADEQERLFRRTTQVEAPLYLTIALQKYIAWGADAAAVWKKYGIILTGILDSYLMGERKEVSMQPNGLLWAQMDGVALTWMNAYIDGRAVTERAGYQVETNAFWYNAINFVIEMESRFGGKRRNSLVKRWEGIRDLVRENFEPTFWNPERGCLADYVDNWGQHREIRPNQLYAIWVDYSPIPEDLHPSILRVIDTELVTSRGIRTLSPRDPAYKHLYDGSQTERDLAYHNGSTRPFLLEPYVETAFRIKGPSFWKRAGWLVEGFNEDLSKHGVGAFSELYDADPPHEPHGAISSALSTAALLAVENALDKNKEA